MNEVFKEIDGFNGRYMVSNLGNVKDNKTGLLRNLYTRKSGYVVVSLKSKYYYVHRLVLLTFMPPDDLSLTVDHVDSVKNFNALTNLQWLTKSENSKKAAREGKRLKGSQQPLSKLTESNVLQVRSECEDGKCSLTALARQYRVTYTTMWKAVRQRTWRHI